MSVGFRFYSSALPLALKCTGFEIEKLTLAKCTGFELNNLFPLLFRTKFAKALDIYHLAISNGRRGPKASIWRSNTKKSGL